MKNIVDTELKLKGKKLNSIPHDLMKEAKEYGFSDYQISITNFFNRA